MKRFLRVSLRSLLLMMTVCCVVLALWMVNIQPFRDQHTAIAMVNDLGGTYSSEPADGPAWQAWLIGKVIDPTAFVKVTEVTLRGVEFRERDAQRLSAFVHLETLELTRSSFNNSSAPALSPLKGLRSLSLRYCDISDEGLAAMGDKPELRELKLTGADVSDQAIENLVRMPKLQSLLIRWTAISDAGAARLRDLLPDCEVHHQKRANADEVTK